MSVLWEGELDKGESHEFDVSEYQNGTQLKITFGNEAGFIDFFLASLANLSGTNHEIIFAPLTEEEFESYVIIPVSFLLTYFPDSFFLLNSNSSSSANNSAFTVELIEEETEECPSCQRVKSIPQCTVILNVGNVDLNDADVLVIFQRVENQTFFSVPGTTDSNGLVSVDLTEFSMFLTPEFTYQIKVIENMDNWNNPLTINVNGTEYDCLLMGVKAVTNLSNDQITGADEITLEINAE